MNHLVKLAKHGDNAAFSELMKLNSQGLYKVAQSYLNNEDDIADAIQETILACYEGLKNLRQPRFFKTWMIRILINKCNDILKDQKRTCSMEVLPEIEVDSSHEDKLAFYELMEMLEEKYRVVLILYYVEGFRIKEIADILSIAENTVKTRLARGRKKFALIFNKVDERSVESYEKKSERFEIIQHSAGKY